LVAAITRTLTCVGRVAPIASNSRSWSTRSSFTWTSSGSSPISSRKIVPWCASAKRPGLRWMAPVNAPFSWPKSSLSASVAGMAPQFTFTITASRRRLRVWIARAISSLPVPVSPNTSTVASVAATFSMSRKTPCIDSALPTISPKLRSVLSSSCR
jgi:hypothetical protein